MNKKLIFSLIGLPLLLVACGELPSESGSGTSAPTGPATLQVWGPNQEQIFLQAKAEEFKTANPNLNINFEFAAIGEPELKSVLTLDIAGGADVFAFPDDQLQNLVTAGALSPVQQFRADVVARNIDWSVDLAKIGDTVYAYPNTADNGVYMYYDKRHITAEQMTSLDSILAVAEEKNSSIVIDPMGGWAMSMWFATSGNISWDIATRVQTIDWNNVAGLNSAKGMFNAYASNRIIRDQGLMPTLFLENETDITKGLIAGVSGTWNANSLTTILGAENIGMIKMPTFTNGAGVQVQLGSMVGAKLIGVNGFTQQPALAHQFANFLTSVDTQKARAIQLGVGPSNLAAAADPLVQVIPSIKAISDQAPFGIPQAKSVSDLYWSPAGAFADAVINEARAIDLTVEANLEAALAANTVQNDPTAIAAFRTAEKARLISLSFETLQDKLDIFVTGVLAVNEG
jgi:arabinogalactan oligomer/maltooligosaccharide transport system substrate-binding protein